MSLCKEHEQLHPKDFSCVFCFQDISLQEISRLKAVVLERDKTIAVERAIVKDCFPKQLEREKKYLEEISALKLALEKANDALESFVFNPDAKSEERRQEALSEIRKAVGK